MNIEAYDDLTIILPTLNEAENIGPMLSELRSLYTAATIIVLDDNSDDGTQNIVSQISEKDERIKLVVRDVSDRGLSASIVDGIMMSTTEYFIVMDCDFQHPPAKVAEIARALREGGDLVIGARTDRGALPPFRRVSSYAAHLLAYTYLWFKDQPESTDIMSGFFGGRTKIVQATIKENYDAIERRGFKILFDILKFCPRDITIKEIDFEFQPRSAGQSKISPLVISSIIGQCGSVGRTISALMTRLISQVLDS